ncbi:hypothetical protein ACVIJ6_007312 [Bradyrhizobium sp. USDA 4369]
MSTRPITSSSSEPCHFSLLRRLWALGEGSQPALEFLALEAAGASEGLDGDGLQDGQRVLDAVIEFLDQQVVQHLGAGDRRRHPHREGKADCKHDAADQAGDGEVAPERRHQRGLADAGADDPARQGRMREARQQRQAFQRHARQRRLVLADHAFIDRGRGRLADRLERIRYARKHHGLAVEQRQCPIGARALLLEDGLEHLDRRTERDIVDHLAVAKHRHLDRDDQALLHDAVEQVGILRLARFENAFGDLAVAPQGEIGSVGGCRRKQLVSVAVSDQDRAVLAVLLEEAHRDRAEALEVAGLQRIRQCQHLHAACHPLHLRIEREADGAHRLEHALPGIGAVLHVVVKYDAAGEQDERQRGPCDQKSKPDRQGKLWHGCPVEKTVPMSDRTAIGGRKAGPGGDRR